MRGEGGRWSWDRIKRKRSWRMDWGDCVSGGDGWWCERNSR
jgi:hypothetical protein